MWYYIFSIVIILVVGLISIIRDIKYMYDKEVFVNEFRDKFHDFMQDIEGNYESYVWLTRNVVKMQRLSGSLGVIYNYQPPNANYVYKSIQLFTNLIPSIRDEYMSMKAMGTYLLGQKSIRGLAVSVDDALLRIGGTSEELRFDRAKDLKNPLIWLRDGVRWIIILPVAALYWTGLIRYGSYSGIAQSFLVRAISAIVALIGFVSSIVTIITGYNPLMVIFKEWGWF